MVQALSSQHINANMVRSPVGEDAYIRSSEGDKPTLLVIVVGELLRERADARLDLGDQGRGGLRLAQVGGETTYGVGGV